MRIRYRSLPLKWQIPLFPVWAFGLALTALWLVLAGIAAIIGVALGQVARILAIALYFIWFYAYIGWQQARDMALRNDIVKAAPPAGQAEE